MRIGDIRSKNSEVMSKSGEAIISVKKKDKTVRQRAISMSQRNIPLFKGKNNRKNVYSEKNGLSNCYIYLYIYIIFCIYHIFYHILSYFKIYKILKMFSGIGERSEPERRERTERVDGGENLFHN